MTGTVIHFNSVKGYGFLSNSAGGPDIFCHYSELIQDGYKKLDKGDIVEFDLGTGPKGKPQAARVVITGKAKV